MTYENLFYLLSIAVIVFGAVAACFGFYWKQQGHNQSVNRRFEAKDREDEKRDKRVEKIEDKTDSIETLITKLDTKMDFVIEAINNK